MNCYQYTWTDLKKKKVKTLHSNKTGKVLSHKHAVCGGTAHNFVETTNLQLGEGDKKDQECWLSGEPYHLHFRTINLLWSIRKATGKIKYLQWAVLPILNIDV